MEIDRNLKIGLIVAISIIALFVLSLLITNAPAGDDNAVRFGILTLLPPLGFSIHNQRNNSFFVHWGIRWRIHGFR